MKFVLMFLFSLFFSVLFIILLKFKGGSVIRLFHKELEAYLVAEGLFDEIITENGKPIIHTRMYILVYTAIYKAIYCRTHFNANKIS